MDTPCKQKSVLPVFFKFPVGESAQWAGAGLPFWRLKLDFLCGDEFVDVLHRATRLPRGCLLELSSCL